MRIIDDDKELNEAANQQSWFWIIAPICFGILLAPKLMIGLIILFGFIL